ncbi:MAG: hypothetical protein ABI224_17260 [Acetobacteraceae bacterium]
MRGRDDGGVGRFVDTDASDRKARLADLQRNRSKSLDAPFWLWNSVVDLVGAHEAAHLRQCRRHALATA